MIHPAFLDELRCRVPVSEVVGRRVRLTRAGREWKGLSPFNKERTPSFFVNDTKQFWHDFSSGKHGDIFTFIMEIEGVTFPQAVERLAAMAGAMVPHDGCPIAASSQPAIRPAIEIEHGREIAEQRRKARWLWSRRKAINGTPAERYLRARGYGGPIPATLGYLPAGDRHLHALIAAYGFAIEPEPGVLEILEASVVGVHLIKLTPDGSDRIRDKQCPKITIGKGFVAPIMLAAVNDLGGLLIAEGIEDALSGHAASGLGAWAAGGATRLPALADSIPVYVASLTVAVDHNVAGRTNSAELAARAYTRGIEARMTTIGGAV